MNRNSSERTIIIHAGPGKTGSSALQHYLLSNQRSLESVGIFYPSHNIDKNNISSGHKRVIYDQVSNKISAQLVEKLKQDFEDSLCQTLILSSEYFHNDIEDIYKFFPEATIVLYVRNPIELVYSGYNQSVKRAQNRTRLSIPHSVRFSVLDKIKDLNSDINIELRPYLFDAEENWNIVSDFLSFLDINLAQTSNNEKVNPSYSLEALETKRILNHLPLNEIDSAIDRILQQFEGETSYYSLVSQTEYKRLSEDLTQQLESYIKTSEDKSLTPLIGALARNPTKKFHEQTISFESYSKAIDYIKNQNNNLFLKINTLSPNGNVYDFYHHYSDAPTHSTSIFSDINKIIDDIKMESIDNETTFCIRLARAFERDENYSAALYVMKLAHQKRPKGKAIISKINEYSNKLALTQVDNQ
ncbi:hypothetical protein [Vibrio sp. 10N]|uniref:hypothetical protein n=1 Tax=Vibrio sp. 10N TaxID=3058938 RepID=UPI002813F9A2|nr:hypothetical protein VB10N_29130 [Vibrio sp. 10N]